MNLERSGLFIEGSSIERATRTSGRFTLHKLGAFKIKMAQQIREWASVIKTMEDALVLYKHKPNSLATQHWEYLHERTGGSIASLHELIRKGAIRAVMNGQEAITKSLMDQITLDGNATRLYNITRRRPRPASQPRSNAEPAAG